MSTNQQQNPINRYNPEYKFPTSSYYPTYPKTETYGVNPLTINSLTSVDVDDLQQIFAKGISDNKNLYKSQYLTRRALLENDHDLRDVKAAINQAKRNQIICRQIEQNHLLRLKNMIKESEEEEEAFRQAELERKKKADEEQKKTSTLVRNEKSKFRTNGREEKIKK